MTDNRTYWSAFAELYKFLFSRVLRICRNIDKVQHYSQLLSVVTLSVIFQLDYLLPSQMSHKTLIYVNDQPISVFYLGLSD